MVVVLTIETAQQCLNVKVGTFLVVVSHNVVLKSTFALCPQVLHGMAQAHARQGNLEAAEQCLLRVQQVQPGNGHLCHTRGVQAQKSGNLVAAAEWFERGKQDSGRLGSVHSGCAGHWFS